MHRILIVLATTLIAWAAAADVVVHPFRSQDPVVGVAVAERVAGALEGVDVLGPELAPALIAPVPVPGGFFNPIAVLPDGVVDRSGVAVLADALGVAAAVSGTLSVGTDALRLELRAAVDGRGRTATVTAAADDLDGLATRATTPRSPALGRCWAPGSPSKPSTPSRGSPAWTRPTRPCATGSRPRSPATTRHRRRSRPSSRSSRAMRWPPRPPSSAGRRPGRPRSRTSGSGSWR